MLEATLTGHQQHRLRSSAPVDAGDTGQLAECQDQRNIVTGLWVRHTFCVMLLDQRAFMARSLGLMHGVGLCAASLRFHTAVPESTTDGGGLA